MTAADLYVIWSFEHNGWWRPGRMGYTQRLAEAGRYSVAEANDICVNANQYLPAGQYHETAVLLSDALEAERKVTGAADDAL